MSINDIFWLFFMFTMLQPLLRQRMLEAMRTRKIAQIERDRNSRVILLVHRQETMRLLGFPLMRYIDVNDSEDVLRAIHMTDDDVPLDIVLHTPGGLVLAALQIARAIRAAGDSTPILALTANAFAEDRRLCLEAGMNDHLVKPLDLESLRAALTRWTKRDNHAKVG